MQTLSIITPVFNEESTLAVFFEQLVNFQKKVKNYQIEWVIVDDGSSDNTPQITETIAKENDFVCAIIFSRNFGKESALFAGLEYSSGDIVIPMDIDLQDPFEVIFMMIEKYEQGAEVVLAKRSSRNNDSFLKRFSAEWFYKLNNKVSSLPLEEHVGDFRLMTRQVVDEIAKLEENQLFMKGLMSWVGFNTEVVTYERPDRKDGTTKFNYRKLWNLAVQGITSFSTVPLKVWTY